MLPTANHKEDATVVGDLVLDRKLSSINVSYTRVSQFLLVKDELPSAVRVAAARLNFVVIESRPYFLVATRNDSSLLDSHPHRRYCSLRLQRAQVVGCELRWFRCPFPARNCRRKRVDTFRNSSCLRSPLDRIRCRRRYRSASVIYLRVCTTEMGRQAHQVLQLDLCWRV